MIPEKDKEVLIKDSVNINVPAQLNVNDSSLSYEQIQYLVNNMPGLNTILEGITDYIFAGEMELVKDDENTIEGETLKTILNSRNIQGVAVIDMFKQLTRELFEQGSVGIRKVKSQYGNNNMSSIMIVPTNAFNIIMQEDEEYPLVYVPKLFLINRYVNSSQKDYWLKSTDKDRIEFIQDKYGNIVSKEKDWIALTSSDFTNITLDGSLIGISPFESDKKRTLLILHLLDYYIHDFKRNGVGTLAFKYNETVLNNLRATNQQTTSTQILDSSSTNAKFNEEKKEKDIKSLAKDLSEVEYNDSIIYSEIFSDMQQLNRDSKPSDYLNLLAIHATRFSCQIYGVSPQVFDLDAGTGNIGKDEVIKTFILHKVIPWRENIAVKLTEVIRLMGYEGYTFRFKNKELVDYHDYEKDEFISRAFVNLTEHGLEEEAKNYIKKHLISEEE